MSTSPAISTSCAAGFHLAEQVHERDFDIAAKLPQYLAVPFVLGVLGDFSGNPAEELPKLKDRKFVEVTPDDSRSMAISEDGSTREAKAVRAPG